MLKKFLLAFMMSMISAASFGVHESILIPGYETIHFKAGEITQDVIFRNPQENNCRFRMSIYLSDGSEVWKADDFLEPGEAFVSIDLERVLERGTYCNAVMKYECYSLDGGAKLNGAEIRVTLEVR